MHSNPLIGSRCEGKNMWSPLQVSSPTLIWFVNSVDSSPEEQAFFSCVSDLTAKIRINLKYFGSPCSKRTRPRNRYAQMYNYRLSFGGSLSIHVHVPENIFSYSFLCSYSPFVLATTTNAMSLLHENSTSVNKLSAT